MVLIDNNVWFQDIMNIVMSDDSRSVLLYVAMGVDSLCTCVMLTNIFKTNNIQYEIVPLQSYEGLIKHQKKILKKNNANASLAEIYSLYMFINSGAMIDLTTFAKKLFASTADHVPHIYVLDSHQPIHLANIFHDDFNEEQDEYVSVPINVIAHDYEHDMDHLKALYNLQLKLDAQREQEERRKQQLEEDNAMDGMRDDNAGEDFFDQDDQAEDDLKDFIVEEDPNNPDILPDAMQDDDGGNLFHTQNGAAPTTYYDAAYDDDDVDFQQNGNKNEVDLYYENTCYGIPSAVTLFRALHVNSKTMNKNDLLWWTIIGLTEYFIMDRIDAELYQALVQEFSGKVSAWNADKRTNFQIQTSNHDSNPDDNLMEDIDEQQQKQMNFTIDIPSANDSRIKFLPEEFIFFCYRHMPFIQSMTHTATIFCSYKLWETQGIENLKYALTRTGVSLEQLEQRWKSMRKQSRADLKHSILQGSHKDFARMDLKFSSFSKNYGMDFKVSASDMVYVLLSLLEQVGESSVDSSVKHNFSDAFSSVYDALHGDVSIIRRGINDAISLQKSLVQQCKDLVSAKSRGDSHRDGVKTVGAFYSVRLERPDPSFLQPLALTRLGLFFLEISRSGALNRSKRLRRNKPIVICAVNQEVHRALVVGIDVEGGVRNSFHTSFMEACDENNIESKHDSFDSHILEMDSVDLPDFLVSLYAYLQGTRGM